MKAEFVTAPAGDLLIPYLQRRAGRALAETVRLERELLLARVSCAHAVAALVEARKALLRSGRVKE